MSQNLRVALTTSLNDQLVGPLRRSVDEVEKSLGRLRDSKGRFLGSSTTEAAREMAEAARQAALLGRNTEKAVTLADRLKTAWSAAGNMMRGVITGIAAFQAAKYVVAAPLQQARSYDRQLADAANTAFPDRNVAGRRAGMAELDATVTGSVRAGGGNRDQALAALNEMLASGSVTAGQAKGLLPTVARYATAGNASITELSTIVVRALQNGFKEADIPKVLDMALAAGQQGGFELKDMAKWLPKLLAAGNMSGLTGMEGYARILASAQGSVITAGSKDEAGNNLLNLLLKINSSDTQRDAKNMGIDLAGSLSAARGQGVNSLDAFVNLVEQIAGRDSRMVALRKQAAGAGSDEQRKSTLNAQADILQGSAIGKIVQDRQALLALVAEMNKGDYIAGVKNSVMGANGQVGAANFGLIAGTADFIAQQKNNEALFAQTRGLSGVNDALAKLDAGTTSLYRNNEKLGAGFEVAKVAVYGLAMAAGAASLAQLAAGGGGLVAMLKRLLGIAPAAALPAAAVPAAAVPAAGGAVAAGGLAGAGVLAGAGLLAGGAVLGAGYLMSEAMNSESGLRSRIDSRQARLNELTELAGLTRDGGGSAASMQRIYGEIDKVTSDRDNLAAKLASTETQVAAERNALAAQAQALTAVAQRPIRVVLDGREIAAAANSYNEFFTRRN